jgi:glycosyltransferase involved in cell wall biosynthesis
MRVSVCLLTYNHERYVAQAIESVLAQEGVDFELVISEDHSTDGTRAIVDGYAARHPDRIRVLTSGANVGMTRAFARGLEAARGTYVALLDGDDYWTSPHKLRLQTEYLDAHPECAICFHNVTVVYEDGSVAPHPFYGAGPGRHFSRPVPKPVSTLADVAPGNFMQTCSVMFRRGLFGDLPEWFTDLAVADWPLHVLNAEHGDIGYIDADMAVYRVHAGGVWAGSLAHYRTRNSVDGLVRIYRLLDRHLGRRFAPEFERRTRSLYLDAARAGYADGRTRDALHWSRAYLSRLPWRGRLWPRELLRALVRAHRARSARSRAPRGLPPPAGPA